VLIYWSVLTIGPMLIGGSLSLTSWLVSQSLGLGKQAPELVVAVLRLGPLFLTSVAFGFLYRTVPNRHVTVLDAVVGGIIASFAFEAMKSGSAISLPALPPTAGLWHFRQLADPADVDLFVLGDDRLRRRHYRRIALLAQRWRPAEASAGSQFVAAMEILKMLYRAYLTATCSTFTNCARR